MTALSDICAALAKAPAPRPGCVRVVIAGPSATTAIWAEVRALRDDSDPRINGAALVMTDAFPGWVLKDLDRASQLHEVTEA